jgi:hypothetical protein
MTVTTNENATCHYSVNANTTYNSGTSFTTTGGTNHSVTISGLTNGTTYKRYIRCMDASGNTNTTDYTITFSVAASVVTPPVVTDTTAPAILTGTPSGNLAVGTTQTNMIITTDENATCHYSATANTAYSAGTSFMSTGAKTHSMPIYSLTNGSNYKRYVRCIDSAGNTNTTDYVISFSVPTATTIDTVPPVRSAGAPAMVLPDGTAQATVSLVTNENATCKYAPTTNVSYANMTNTFAQTGATAHSQSLTLTNGTTYTGYVRCMDTAGNVNNDDYMISFSVANPTVTPPPVVTPPATTTPPVVPVTDVRTDDDNEGLFSDLEIAIGTNPNKADTDNDGYNDKQEVLSGYNPTVAGARMYFDTAFTYNQRGKIFIQIESKGQAWYVNPTDSKRYFLNRPADAYTIIRKFAIGVSHSVITYNQGKAYPCRYRGKILLDVGDGGKAYYIDPVNGKAFFLGSPTRAYEVIRQQGIGITNANLAKIRVGLVQ